ncbi:uncharacterized protein KZ484_012659 [Pholidichthys leucotaenia]
MAKSAVTHSEMVRVCQSDGINVIFDQKSPDSSTLGSPSRSRSRSRGSSVSSRYSGSYGHHGRRQCHYRSSSSSSSSSSRSASSLLPRSRSRSYPRCHRRSSRCRCDDHRRRHRGCDRRSPPRRYRARSRSYSRSPDRYSNRRRYRSPSRSRSRSPARWSFYRRYRGQYRHRFSPSPLRSYRSRSRSAGSAVRLSLNDKRGLLEAAKANAMKILGVEKIDLPKSVKPILSEPESKSLSPEPETRVRQGPKKKMPQRNEEEPDDYSPKMSPRRKIAFSVNNAVAKPTVAAPTSAKVTPRVDSIESRKHYGQWIPVKSGQSSARRHS